MIQTPSTLVLPASAVLLEDVDEELFLVYTRKLQLESARASGDAAAQRESEALGYLDGREGVLPVVLTITDPAAAPAPPSTKGKGRRTAARKGRAEVVVEVEVHQALDALRHRRGDTGSVLWRSSLHLAHYFLRAHHFPSPASPPLLPSLANSSILELGSGTGFLGIALRSIWGAQGRWIFTDQLENLPLVVRNLRANGVLPLDPAAAGKHPATKGDSLGPRVEVVELDWVVEAALWDRHPGSLYSHSIATRPCSSAEADTPSPPDILLAADCIYNPSLSPYLAKTLLRHAGPRSLVLVAAELRDPEPLEAFLRAWSECGRVEGWRMGRAEWAGSERERVGRIAEGSFALWVGWREEAVTHEETG